MTIAPKLECGQTMRAKSKRIGEQYDLTCVCIADKYSMYGIVFPGINLKVGRPAIDGRRLLSDASLSLVKVEVIY